MTIQKTYASIDEFHDDLVLLVQWLAVDGSTPDQIVDAVVKPWHYAAEIEAARACIGLDPS